MLEQKSPAKCVHASVCFCGKGREHGLYSPRTRTRKSAATPRSWSQSRDGASPAMWLSSRRAGKARRGKTAVTCVEARERRWERRTPAGVAITPGHHHVHSGSGPVLRPGQAQQKGSTCEPTTTASTALARDTVLDLTKRVLVVVPSR